MCCIASAAIQAPQPSSVPPLIHDQIAAKWTLLQGVCIALLALCANARIQAHHSCTAMCVPSETRNSAHKSHLSICRMLCCTLVLYQSSGCQIITFQGLLLQETFAYDILIAVPQPSCLLISAALRHLSSCCLSILICCIALSPFLHFTQKLVCPVSASLEAYLKLLLASCLLAGLLHTLVFLQICR